MSEHEFFKDAPLLQAGDLFATEPSGGFQRWVCNTFLDRAKTFHWGVITHQWIAPDDYGISESIGKGVCPGLLSFYNDKPLRVYRVKPECWPNPDWATPENLEIVLQYLACKYGRSYYDFPIYVDIGWWYILRRLGLKSKIKKDARFYCQEYVVRLMRELGVDLVPPDEYPICKNLEESPVLDLIYEEF